MRLRIRIIRANDFLKTTVRGQFDLKGSREAFQSLIHAREPLDHHNVMLDLRDLPEQLTDRDLIELVNLAAHQRCWFQQIMAILKTDEPRFENAAFKEFCAQDRRLRMACFGHCQEALVWLLNSQESSLTYPQEFDRWVASLPH